MGESLTFTTPIVTMTTLSSNANADDVGWRSDESQWSSAREPVTLLLRPDARSGVIMQCGTTKNLIGTRQWMRSVDRVMMNEIAYC